MGKNCLQSCIVFVLFFRGIQQQAVPEIFQHRGIRVTPSLFERTGHNIGMYQRSSTIGAFIGNGFGNQYLIQYTSGQLIIVRTQLSDVASFCTL